MSNRNNDVFQVLITKGNQAVLAAGNTIDDLLPGQIGVFDEDKKLSIGAATTPMPRNISFAVGINRSGGATLEDIRESAGQFIQRPGISNYSFKPHTAGQPMIVEVGDYMAQCDTDYGIRVEFRNSRIYRTQGTNQFSKAYIVRTACCDDCAEGCGTADPNELTILMVNEINNDEAGLLIANATARQDVTTVDHGTSVDYSAGDVMTLADVQALITFNALGTTLEADRVYTDFTLQSVPLKVAAFCQINLHYHKLLQTTIIVSLIEGFGCSGVVTTIQEIVYEEGTYTNIKQLEYHASAWNGAGPYVASSVLGLAMDNVEYFAVSGTNYDQFILEYEFSSKSGWGEYENPLSTIFAIPEPDTVTRNGLAAVIDAVVAGLGFEALADDAALANVGPTVVEPSASERDDVTKDGLA